MRKIVKYALSCAIASVSVSAMAASQEKVIYDIGMSSENYFSCTITIGDQPANVTQLANATVNLSTQNILLGGARQGGGKISNLSAATLLTDYFVVRPDNKGGHFFKRATSGSPTVIVDPVGFPENSVLHCVKSTGTNLTAYSNTDFG